MVGETAPGYPQSIDEVIDDLRSRVNKARVKKQNAVSEISRQEQIFSAAEAEETAYGIALDNLLNMGTPSGPKRRKTGEQQQPRQANGKFSRKGQHEEYEDEE